MDEDAAVDAGEGQVARLAIELGRAVERGDRDIAEAGADEGDLVVRGIAEDEEVAPGLEDPHIAGQGRAVFQELQSEAGGALATTVAHGAGSGVCGAAMRPGAGWMWM